MNPLEQQLARLLVIVAKALAGLLGLYLSGQITREDFNQSVALTITTARVRAANVGADLVRREVEQQTGQEVPIVPPQITRTDDVEGARKAVETITADAPDRHPERKGVTVTPKGTTLEVTGDGLTEEERATADEIAVRTLRLARAESARAAQDAAANALAQEPLVEGWVRDLNGDACELCVWWWREGRVWPKDYVMPRHTGCECQQQPVTRRYIQNPTRKGWDRSARDKNKQQEESNA